MITGDSMAITLGQNHQYFAPAEMKANLTAFMSTLERHFLVVTMRVNSSLPLLSLRLRFKNVLLLFNS